MSSGTKDSVDVVTKVCNTCDEEKALAEYYARKDTSDGRYGVCKSYILHVL